MFANKMRGFHETISKSNRLCIGTCFRGKSFNSYCFVPVLYLSSHALETLALYCGFTTLFKVIFKTKSGKFV